MMTVNRDRSNRVYYLSREFWTKACRYDEVTRESPFVVFSKDNPYAEYYSRACGLWARLRKAESLNPVSKSDWIPMW